MSPSVTIRTATVDDLDALLQVEHACEEAPHWREDAWLSMLGGAVEPRWQRVVIAEVDEVIAGFIVFAGLGEIAELESVAVLRAFRSRGLGRALCLAAMEQAAQKEARTMELEVRATSDVPRRLYASLGFLEQGIRRGYYRDPEDDAVLMSVALPAPEIQMRKV
jgi:ribosomal protein S18 acetylase RimI-like enzyme